MAITDAMLHASAQGSLVVRVETPGFPCDFLAIRDGRLTIVRVRRIKCGRYSPGEIGASCRQEIAALRKLHLAGDVTRELWVRGPDRHWHRYQVRPDQLESGDDSCR
jgi:hypothetical protein